MRGVLREGFSGGGGFWVGEAGVRVVPLPVGRRSRLRDADPPQRRRLGRLRPPRAEIRRSAGGGADRVPTVDC